MKPRYYRDLRWLLGLLCLLQGALTHAFTPLEIADAARYDLGLHVELLEDKEGTLDIARIQAESDTLGFSLSSSRIPNLGFTSNPVWLRFQLNDLFSYHPDRRWLLELDFPFADNVELYTPQADGGYQRQSLGDRQAFGERAWKHRTLIFDLGRVTEPAFYYMRVEASGATYLPLRIWAPRALSSHLATENLVMGLYYGIMLAMLIYNLFVYTIIRDQNYLRYCEYLFVFLLLQVAQTGHGYQYIWNAFPSLANLLPTLLVPAACMTAVHFAQTFMEIPERRPELMPWLRGIYYLCAGTVALCLIAPLWMSIPVAVITGLLTALFLLIASVMVLRRGSRPAQFFLAAWLMLLTGALLKCLAVMGLLPVNNLTHHMWQFGSGLEVLLLSLGLADRINILRQERMSAIQQAFELEKVAHTDRLTGLSNRTFFEREFRQHVGYAEKNKSSHFAFFLIDLVGLKAINDNHGHAIGDQAVRMTARMLKSICRQSDLVSRLGGDEFAIICPRMTVEDYQVFVHRVEEKTADGRIKFQENGEIKVIPIHLSIGHAHTTEVPPGEIFDFADKDMYAKKAKFYETHERHRPVVASNAQTVSE